MCLKSCKTKFCIYILFLLCLPILQVLYFYGGQEEKNVSKLEESYEIQVNSKGNKNEKEA